MNKKADSFDILGEFCKQDIISWLKHNIIGASIKRSDLLYARWERESQQILEEGARLQEERHKIDTKKLNEYARQFNETRDSNQRLKLIELMKPIQKEWDENMRKEALLAKKWDRATQLYEQCKKAREEEYRS